MSESEVEFSVLIDNALVTVSSSRKRALSLALARCLHPNTLLSAFKVYRMQTPVAVGSPSEDNTQLVQACAVGARTLIRPEAMMVGQLAEDLSIFYVYVVLELAGVPRKRSAEEAGILDWFTSAKFGKLAPSSMDFSHYRSLQKDREERLFDHRAIAGTRGPHPDDLVPPISLLYQPFGTFIDTYLGMGRNAAGAPPSLKGQVDDFANEMAQIHANEDRRRDAGLTHLDLIFCEALAAGLSPIRAASFGRYGTDGHILGPRGMPIFIVEFKNEAAGISSIPVVELCAYYNKFIAEVSKDLQLSSRMPALGLTVVGPVITFYAIAFVGRVHYTALTSSISCVHRAVNGYDRHNLYNAFAAAVELLRCITQDVYSTESLSPLHHLYPAITELPYFENPSNSIKFKIIKPLFPATSRYVYLATSSNDTGLIIKFTSSYSADLHVHCVRDGHAPKLRGYAKLPGDIIAIAMDLVSDAETLDSKESSLDDKKNWADQLKQLVESFHAAGYVHGDLRCPNILVAGNKVMLIDFDWGGKEGEAFYPHGRLNSQLTEGRKEGGLMITKEDDRRVLAITLKEIGIGS